MSFIAWLKELCCVEDSAASVWTVQLTFSKADQLSLQTGAVSLNCERLKEGNEKTAALQQCELPVRGLTESVDAVKP